MKVKVNNEWVEVPAFKVETGISEEYYTKLIEGHLDEPLIIPEGTTTINIRAFYYLNFGGSAVCPIAVIPEAVTKIGNEIFRYARVKKIEFKPQGLKDALYPFANNTDLEEIVVWGNVFFSHMVRDCTNLKRVFAMGTPYFNTGAVNGCTSLELLDLSNCISVPTLINTSTFTNVPTTCEIRVPSALYNSWITATNWSTLYAQGYNFVAV